MSVRFVFVLFRRFVFVNYVSCQSLICSLLFSSVTSVTSVTFFVSYFFLTFLLTTQTTFMALLSLTQTFLVEKTSVPLVMRVSANPPSPSFIFIAKQKVINFSPISNSSQNTFSPQAPPGP